MPPFWGGSGGSLGAALAFTAEDAETTGSVGSVGSPPALISGASAPLASGSPALGSPASSESAGVGARSAPSEILASIEVAGSGVEGSAAAPMSGRTTNSATAPSAATDKRPAATNAGARERLRDAPTVAPQDADAPLGPEDDGAVFSTGAPEPGGGMPGSVETAGSKLEMAP